MHTYRFCGLDLLLCLEENRKDREDRRVHMGAVARRARMPPRFVEEPVEGLPVLLPQRATVVHPVVQDRLEVQAVRRDRAAHRETMGPEPIRCGGGEGSVKVLPVLTSNEVTSGAIGARAVTRRARCALRSPASASRATRLRSRGRRRETFSYPIVPP